MNEHELNENVFDQLLKYSAENYLEHLSDEYPSDKDLDRDVSFSMQFEKKMNRLFKREKYKENAHKRGSKIIKGSLAAAAAIFVCLIVVSNAQALRVPILNYFNSIGKQSTSIQVQDNTDFYSAFKDQIKGLCLPSYIPDAYKIKRIDRGDIAYSIVFDNDSSDIILLQNLIGNGSAGVDSEGAAVEQLTVNGESAEFFIKNNTNNLVFEYSQKAFLLSGTLPKNELIKIAQSMKYIK
jgi:hypothetical protein